MTLMMGKREMEMGGPHLGALRVLDLYGNHVTDPAVRSALLKRFGPGVKL